MMRTLLATSAAAALLAVPTAADAQVGLAPGNLAITLDTPDTFVFSVEIIASGVDDTLADLSAYSLGFTFSPAGPDLQLSGIDNDSFFAFAPDATFTPFVSPTGDAASATFDLVTPDAPVNGEVLGTLDFSGSIDNTIGAFLLEIDESNTSFTFADGGTATLQGPTSFFIPEPATAGLLGVTALAMLRRRR
jgi:hypothetical protein